MIPVIVMRNKSNPGRYLAADMDAGDWSDENLDVAMEDIKNAYMIIRHDLTEPTKEDFEAYKAHLIGEKKRLIELYGEHASVSLDFEAVCNFYDPANIVITKDQYEYAMSWGPN